MSTEPKVHDQPAPEASEQQLPRRHPRRRKTETKPNEQRRHPRYSVAIMVDVLFPGGVTVGVVTDISLGGALVTTVEELGMGAEVHLKAAHALSHGQLSLPAVVRRYAHGAAGVQFTDISPTSLGHLELALEELS